MDERMFRKESLDNMKSPDKLDEYIKLANPGVWLILISIIMILIGACVWGFLGRIDHTASVSVQIKDGTAVCYVSEDDIDEVKPGMEVQFENLKAVIKVIGESDESGYQCGLEMTSEAADGIYDGKVIIESFKPMKFILN